MNLVRIILFLSCFISFSYSIGAQTLMDSLTTLAKAAVKNEAWVDAMSPKVKHIIHIEPKTALKFSEHIFETATALGYRKGIQSSSILKAKILNVLGDFQEAKLLTESLLEQEFHTHHVKASALIILASIHVNLGNLDAALATCNQAEKIIENDKESILFGDLVNCKADAMSLKGNYTSAIAYYLQAAKIYKQNNVLNSLAVVYNSLGSENRWLKYHGKALEYYGLSATINEANNDFFNLATNYANMGVSYKALDSLDKAIVYYKKSLTLSERLGSTLVMAQNYMNLANIYKKVGKQDKAIEFYNKSLKICKTDNIVYGLVLNYANLGMINLELHNYKTAIVHLDSALVFAKKSGMPREEALVYEQLSEAYKAKNNYKEAFKFQSLRKIIDDSLLTAEKHAQIMELQTKYETVQNQKNLIELSEKQTKQELTISNLMVLSLVLVILVICVSVWFLYKREKAAQEKKIAQIKADNMALEIQVKNNELTQKALNIVHLQENTKGIATDIDKLLKIPEVSNKEMLQLLRKIKFSSKHSNIWDEFDLRFKSFYGDFQNRIISEYPDLSPVELRIISLLRLNLTTKEIAEIMQRSAKTIENKRSIVRKKLNLDTSENLTSFILSF